MKLLLADDDSDFAPFMEGILRTWGYDVTVAATGTEAWEILQFPSAPRLVLLDWTMPGLDGAEICRRMRHRKQKEYTYIIMVSAHQKDEDIVAGLEAGADDYVTKPIKLNELKVRLSAGKRIIKLQHKLLVMQRTVASHAADLEAANQDLENFTYTLANDLLNSLLSIANKAKTLQDLLRESESELCKSSIRGIYQKTRRLADLVNAMHNFLSMRSEMHREDVDLTLLAHEAAESFQEAVPSRAVEFIIAEDLTVNGDKNMLRVVLNNLFDNAFRHTESREEAVIEFGACGVEGGRAYFVRDNGSGFEPKEAHRLFKPFQKLPGTEEMGGEGLGLATVARIIVRHGGKTWAEGEPGKGATFYFTVSEE